MTKASNDGDVCHGLANVATGLDSTIIITAIPAIADLHEPALWAGLLQFMLFRMFQPQFLDQSRKIVIKPPLNCRCSFVFRLYFKDWLIICISSFWHQRALMGSVLEEMGSQPYIMAGFIFDNIKAKNQDLGYLGAALALQRLWVH